VYNPLPRREHKLLAPLAAAAAAITGTSKALHGE